MEAAAMEVEDDVFFADLSRQISLLIMDDEDHQTSATHCPSVSLEVFSEVMHPKRDDASQFMYEQMSRRESKGTGVFIPQRSSHHHHHHLSRRKNRHAKFSSSYSKYQTPSSHNSPPLINSPHNKNLHTNDSTRHPFNSTTFP